MQRWLSPRVGYGLVVALYLLSFPYHPKLRSPNELCRLWQSRSLVDFGTLDINGTIQERGMVGDLSCTATVNVDGVDRLFPCVGPNAPARNVVKAVKYYPSKAPLLSFLGAPVYRVLKLFGPVSELSQVFWSRLILTITPALLLLWLVRRVLAAYVQPATADLFTIVYAMGTMAFSYAEAFMSHQTTAVLLFSAFFCAWKVERKEWALWGYALAGLAAGAAVVAEYTAALAVVSVAAYTVAARWKQWKALAQAVGLVIVGALPLLLLLCWYHAATFGSPLTSGYKFLNDANYMGWHEGGFLGIKLPDARAFFLSFFSPLRGLFALSPFLIVSFFGLKALKAADRAVFVMLVVILLTHAYFTSSFNYDSWGWTVGPRHLTGIIPFLLIPAALCFELVRERSKPLAGLVAGLCISSVIATGFVGFVNYVPSDVSTSFWKLSIPLLSDGYFPVSVFVAFVANPASGSVLIVLLLALIAWVIFAFRARGAVTLVALAVVVVHLGALKLVPRAENDEGALRFIESVWLAPAGAVVQFQGP